MTPCRAPPHGQQAFTLVEVMVVLLIVVVLASVALPSFRQHSLRTGRLDAMQALMKVQVAQEQHRSAHGLYAGELTALQGTAPISMQGLYAVSLQLTGPEAYLARAAARGEQQHDSRCPELTLSVQQGFPTEGPSSECWSR
jgi:type IV pilus assembly protein PilE